MDISIEKIIHAVKSIKGLEEKEPEIENINSENLDSELNETEKNVLLILESSGFFDENVDIKSLEKIKLSSEFVSDNISEIFDRTSIEKKSDSVSACPSCGAVGIAGATYCYNCGAKIESAKKTFLNLPLTKTKNKFFEMVKIPTIEIASSLVTQEIWNQVMGYNPSYFKSENNPVENISWYDAICFCNELSKLFNYSPCYFVNESDDIRNWGFVPGQNMEVTAKVKCNFHSNGFRLPTVAEWTSAASGRDNFVFAGSNHIDEVAWFRDNSVEMTHPVCEKRPNHFELYDMSGNVYEWCWDTVDSERCYCGGSWKSRGESCGVNFTRTLDPNEKIKLMGFRVVRSL